MENKITIKEIESQIDLTKKMCMSKLSEIKNDFCSSILVKLNGIGEGYYDPFFEYDLNALENCLFIRNEYDIYKASAVRYYANENEWTLLLNNQNGEILEEVCVEHLAVDEMLDLIIMLMIKF